MARKTPDVGNSVHYRIGSEYKQKCRPLRGNTTLKRRAGKTAQQVEVRVAQAWRSESDPWHMQNALYSSAHLEDQDSYCETGAETGAQGPATLEYSGQQKQ